MVDDSFLILNSARKYTLIGANNAPTGNITAYVYKKDYNDGEPVEAFLETEAGGGHTTVRVSAEGVSDLIGLLQSLRATILHYDALGLTLPPPPPEEDEDEYEDEDDNS